MKMTLATLMGAAPPAVRSGPLDTLALEFERRNDGPRHDWLNAVRGAARQMVTAFGLPVPALERWKYTNLAKAVKGRDFTWHGYAFQVDGGDQYVRTLPALLADAPGWLRALLENADDGDDYGYKALRLIGDAFLADGLVVDVPAGHHAAQPLRLSQPGAEGAFYAPRLIVRLGEGASLTILETHEGRGAYWKNGVTQIVLGANAQLRHVRIQDDSAKAIHTQSTQVWLERDATYDGFTLTTGAALSRNQQWGVLEQAGGNCAFKGITLQRGTQHGDTTMLVEHRAPHGRSDQFLRSVLDDQAHGVYQGKVHVHRDAQKTDGYQLSNAILLSEGAEMDTKPELEIYADDVKCSHGATTGQLDENPLFYMRARGIPEAEARAMLVAAFLEEAVDRIADIDIRALVSDRALAWLK